jgi:hypothetical protein
MGRLGLLGFLFLVKTFLIRLKAARKFKGKVAAQQCCHFTAPALTQLTLV